MSVGILLVTHNRIGHALVETLRCTLGDLSLATALLDISQEHDPDERLAAGRLQLELLDSGAGVLVLTDAYGSTPSNIANRLATNPAVRTVAGVNLPMLLKIYNYARLDLDALAAQAVAGGQRGILLCQPPTAS